MLKSTGIVRKVDELGRVVIPIKLRRTMGIDEKDAPCYSGLAAGYKVSYSCFLLFTQFCSDFVGH